MQLVFNFDWSTVFLFFPQVKFYGESMKLTYFWLWHLSKKLLQSLLDIMEAYNTIALGEGGWLLLFWNIIFNCAWPAPRIRHLTQSVDVFLLAYKKFRPFDSLLQRKYLYTQSPNTNCRFSFSCDINVRGGNKIHPFS